MDSNSRLKQKRANRLSERPLPFIYRPYPDVSQHHVFRQRDLVRAESFRPLNGETVEAQYQGLQVGIRPQLLIVTDNLSCLMEWDVYNYLAQTCTVRALIAGLRDNQTKQLANQIVLKFQTQEDLLISLQALIPLSGIDCFLIPEDKRIMFPPNFNNNGLQNGLNFSRVPAQFTNSSNELKWFVRQLEDNPLLREHFPVPGSTLGQGYESQWFYKYEPLTQQYHAKNPPDIVSSTDQEANLYRSRQAAFLRLEKESFPRFHQYTTDRRKIDIARTIECPQQARVYLQYGIISEQLRQTMNNDYTNRQIKTAFKQIRPANKNYLGKRQHDNQSKRPYKKAIQNKKQNTNSECDNDVNFLVNEDARLNSLLDTPLLDA